MTQTLTTAFLNVTDVEIKGYKNGQTYVRQNPHIPEANIKPRLPVSIDNTNKTTTVVFNPYSHEAVFAAAILQNAYGVKAKNLNFLTFQDNIPVDSDNYIWIGVKPQNFIDNPAILKNENTVIYDYSQPSLTRPRHLSILARALGKKVLSDEEIKMNRWVDYISGGIDFDEEFYDIPYMTLIDKVMCDFNIEDIGRYGYRHLSIISQEWEKDKVNEDQEALYYVNIMTALDAVERRTKFELRHDVTNARAIYGNYISGKYRTLTHKTSVSKVETVNGSAVVAVISMEPEMFYVAQRHFMRLGQKYLNVTQGMHGRIAVGNVRIKNQTWHGQPMVYGD